MNVYIYLKYNQKQRQKESPTFSNRKGETLLPWQKHSKEPVIHIYADSVHKSRYIKIYHQWYGWDVI